ncbi:flagellar basal-body MS-ring/collar protein FliF [Clostridium sp. HV4-5-A1G]|uniref:flagellar basal-body MS-ring/collar protein FliF n=1 Tax=Clostridium sp. HV4-5-A1G TaxID=2004595 RepID=UPI00123A453B|nr:flagellar basal-body MS-ring/collar protein FliF [Clostridium sp. HV4-5-A1G]KAA8675183.1 flagellar basal body M-ring protein FliF [Clostridium sp. HV4-5-A1G]
MGKLSQFFKNLIDKWKNLSRNKKIAFGVIAVGIIAAIIFGGMSLGKKKYAVLFSNMNETDSAAVYKKLQDDKVDVKVEGNSILVPKDEVDSDRMKVLSEVQLTNGSQGFELFDKSNLGTTDAEIKVNYQRALQGELERTIKSLPQVEDARVHLVLPDDTEFVKDTQPGSASVTLKLKSGQKLSQDQVKALVALISGGVKNIPKENVQVIDDKMQLLSKDLYQDEGTGTEDSTVPAEKQQQLQQQYEKDLEKRLLSMLETVYGKGKVQVRVNADLDFDAVQQDATTYDPNRRAVVSEHTINSTNAGGTNNAGASPVDNNMSNTTTTTGNNGNSTYNEATRNYDVSKSEQKTVKAPGSVRRLTASVALDGNVDDATRNSIRNLAVSSIGYDANRGDTINVEGIPFDTTAQDNAKKDMDAMDKAEQLAKRNRLIAIIGGIAAAVIATVVGVILWRRKHEEEDLFDEEMEPQGIDAVVGDETQVKEKPKFKPVELESENEDTHVENEIKKYAKDKPDQVADIIKSWLAEDER